MPIEIQDPHTGPVARTLTDADLLAEVLRRVFRGPYQNAHCDACDAAHVTTYGFAAADGTVVLAWCAPCCVEQCAGLSALAPISPPKKARRT